MRTITARNPHDSLSFSRRHFKWPVLGKSKSHGATFGDEEYMKGSEAEEEDEATMAFSSACPSFHSEDFVSPPLKPAAGTAPAQQQQQQTPRRRKVRTAVSRLRSALANAVAGRHRQVGLGARLTGTLYGHRRGHVNLAFQVDPRACPALLLELAAPTAALVREMASGLVRIALECERAKGSALPIPTAGPNNGSGNGKKLLEETVWRAYCNGKSCGYAVRRECGAADWRVLRALEPVSMGAGVIPAASCGGGEGDVMYMRARFERVVGSRDSEAFYMMNPDNSSGGGGHGGPELSVYLLRV
ncbi:Protein MIZU-KUSSEI 1 [Dichanthelium oligosanthes]|uniref:Protein MIZU-KUSSEI 1 n=1 Tax=Dichanthelium oligosanthes TaxID=888268 RepID=A0A1E5UZJ7_9POAL|nr:Protein MIZU-KUSSEI 1 [Dichanthelium oligosanthes]